MTMTPERLVSLIHDAESEEEALETAREVLNENAILRKALRDVRCHRAPEKDYHREINAIIDKALKPKGL